MRWLLSRGFAGWVLFLPSSWSCSELKTIPCFNRAWCRAARCWVSNTDHKILGAPEEPAQGPQMPLGCSGSRQGEAWLWLQGAGDPEPTQCLQCCSSERFPKQRHANEIPVHIPQLLSEGKLAT